MDGCYAMVQQLLLEASLVDYNDMLSKVGLLPHCLASMHTAGVRSRHAPGGAAQMWHGLGV